MKRLALLFACVAVLLAPSRGAAQSAADAAQSTVPRLINFNGEVRTATGDLRTGNVLLTFGLYTDQTGGQPLWVEQQAVSLDSRGQYSTILGTLTQGGLPADVFVAGTGRWLGVAVDANPEQPRFMLLSVPYALKAADADTVGGKAPTDFVLTTNLSDKVREAVHAGNVSSNPGNVGTLGLNAVLKSDGAGGHTDTVAPIFETAGGNVGIGTTAPAAKLNVVGGTTFLQPSSAGASQGLQINTADLPNGSNAFFANAPTGWTGNIFKSNLNSVEQWAINQVGTAWFGKLGVGTSSPATKLNVVGGTTYLQPSSATANQGLQIDLVDLPVGSNAFFANAPLGWTGNIFKSNLNNVEQWAINQVGTAYFGKLGVGTSSPLFTLHVVGDAKVTGAVTVDGNIAAKYQDVAEWVETSAPIEPATVVIVDPSHPNHVLPAARAYDPRVAGAVSRQPGLVLGERSDTKAMVAQSGRVHVKVDAKYGAIRIGDLLVTSPTPGYAMRSRPMRVGGQTMHRPGTLLGKALEALPSGKGEILVLLTLQ